MEKYKYLGLIIEMTRRCNLQCAHCMRGDTQDVTITREVIDRIIENVDDCLRFQLTGGEPLLALDELEYLVDRIIEKDYSADMIDFVTNGTVQDQRVIDILGKFCKSKPNRKASIAISNDQFHSGEMAEKAFAFYKEAGRDVPEIEIRYSGEIGERDGDTLKAFILAGRGKMLPQGTPRNAVRSESITDHRICIGDTGKSEGWVMCNIQINANGGVGLFEQRSYDTIDAMLLGNILDTSMHEMIQRHNATCLINCWEVQLLELWHDYRACQIRGGKKPGYKYDIAELIADIAEAFILRTIAARERAHSKWPAIPAQEIILALPIPEIGIEFNDTLQDILDHSDKLRRGDFDKYISQQAKESANRALDDANKNVLNSFVYGRQIAEELEKVLTILALLRKPGARFATNKYYGNGCKDDELEEFKRLAQLNVEYESGKRTYDNSKPLCDMKFDAGKYCGELYLKAKTSAFEKHIAEIEKLDPLTQAFLKGIVGQLV